MSIAYARLPDLAIPDGTKPSNALTALDLEDAVAIVLTAPATIAESLTYVIQVRRWGAATWTTLQEGDIGVALADVLAPAAAKSQCYEMSRLGISAFHSFRINASGVVSDALRVWEATKLWEGM